MIFMRVMGKLTNFGLFVQIADFAYTELPLSLFSF